MYNSFDVTRTVSHTRLPPKDTVTSSSQRCFKKTNKISKERSSYKRSLGVVDESVIECVLNEFIFSGFANFFYGQFDVLSIFVYPSSCLYAVISHIQHIHHNSRNSPVKTPLIPSPSPSPSMSP